MKKNMLPNAAIVLGLANALMVLLSSFGVRLSDQQVDAVQGVLSALLVIAGAYFHPDVPVGVTKEKLAEEEEEKVITAVEGVKAAEAATPKPRPRPRKR